jgi:hypothetical protein
MTNYYRLLLTIRHLIREGAKEDRAVASKHLQTYDHKPQIELDTTT